MPQRILITLLALYCTYSFSQTGEECTKIQSPVLRLTCFDKIFQTPLKHVKHPVVETDNILSRNVSQIYNLDSTHNTEADNFTVWHQGETIKIALKSQSESDFSPVMFLGCIDNITHFQVALKRPIDANKVFVTITDTQSQQPLVSNEWQVLERGHLLDIGRGLFAIEEIKKMLHATEITFQVSPLKYSWHFNIENLSKHIKPLRESCGW